MFGLGLLELAVIAGVVVLLFGASGAAKLVKTARSLGEARKSLSPTAMLESLTKDEPATKKDDVS